MLRCIITGNGDGC
jgi:hypothetical protein